MASSTVAGALLTGSSRLPCSSSQIPRKPSSSSPLLCVNSGDLSAPYNCPLRLSRARAQTTLRNSKSFAVGKGADSDVSEDSDEMFDDLFNKYGKVVYKSDDLKSPAAEVDDDAESLAFAVEMAKVASEVKAGDIKVLFVKPLVYWTRFFIITTAFSRPQIDAIGSRMRDLAEKKYGRVANGDVKPNAWTLLDYGDVVIHIFLPPQRAFYNLEDFYGNAMSVPLPFQDDPPVPPRSL
ncbi:Protein Iojap [Hirschfeldia incana]|nr:Protein Iojap [Hirschfeldia incana]